MRKACERTAGAGARFVGQGYHGLSRILGQHAAIGLTGSRLSVVLTRGSKERMETAVREDVAGGERIQ